MGAYSLVIENGALSADLLNDHAVVVVDAALQAGLPDTTAVVLPIQATEDAKSLAGCERVITDLLGIGVTREHRLIAIGGGVVQDIATFVAQVYKRGISWTYCPTTLMAMADSCIGGKSSINIASVKNVVGGFHPPQRVVIDPQFLRSLSDTAIAAGLAEAAKICYCRNRESFAEYLKRYSRFTEDPIDLLDHVLAAKKWFIEIDEFDQRERRLLNFGHTFGHAIESAVDHQLAHGTAVAIGMLCAGAHAAAADSPQLDSLREHCRDLLASSTGVGEALGHFDPEAFHRAFMSDKKHAAGAFHLILPAPNGSVREVVLDADAAAWRDVESATSAVLDELKVTVP